MRRCGMARARPEPRGGGGLLGPQGQMVALGTGPAGGEGRWWPLADEVGN